MGTNYLDWLCGVVDDGWDNNHRVHWIKNIPNVSLEFKSGSHWRSVPDVRSVYFNETAGTTVIVWEDGVKTIVRCMEGEKFEPYVGFCMAVIKRLYGTTSAAKKQMTDHDAAAAEAKKAKVDEERKAAQHELEKRNHDRKIRSLAKRMQNLTEALEVLIAEAGSAYDEAPAMPKARPGRNAGDYDGDLSAAIRCINELLDTQKEDGENG